MKTKESEGNGIKDLKQALDKLQLAKKAAEEAEKKKKEEENKIDVIPDPEANVAEKPPPCFRFYEYLHDQDLGKVEEKVESEKEAKEETLRKLSRDTKAPVINKERTKKGKEERNKKSKGNLCLLLTIYTEEGDNPVGNGSDSKLSKNCSTDIGV